MFRLPVVGYVGRPLIWISGRPSGLPSVLKVGPGVSATYGTDVTAVTTSPASTQTPAIIRVTSRRDMGGKPLGMAEAYALLTHSLSPPRKNWCFQIGTVALTSSISASQAANASARCAALTAATTAR